MSRVSSAPSLTEFNTQGRFEVLVVQSNPADSFLTIEAFKAAGLTNGLRCVSEGEEALMYVERRGSYADALVPDLIFLDLSQPSMSALEMLRAVKSSPALMHIPVVVAAGSDDPRFVRSVYALNGNCFIRKPTSLDEFARFIETCYQFWSRVVTLAPGPRRHKGISSLRERPFCNVHHLM